jgi:hypothetical protein
VILYCIRLREAKHPEESDIENMEFFESHGTFLKDIRVHRMGKRAAVFLVFMRFVYQSVPVIAIFCFFDRPLFSIFFFLGNELVYTGIYLRYKPFKVTFQAA